MKAVSDGFSKLPLHPLMRAALPESPLTSHTLLTQLTHPLRLSSLYSAMNCCERVRSQHLNPPIRDMENACALGHRLEWQCVVTQKGQEKLSHQRR